MALVNRPYHTGRWLLRLGSDMSLIFAISWLLLVTSGSSECATLHVYSVLCNHMPCCEVCSWLVPPVSLPGAV